LSTSLIVILVVIGVVLLAGGGFFIFVWRRRLEEEAIASANDGEDPTIELLKKVRKIEIKTKGISKQIFSGEYHSAFKGRGMSFSEVRSYQYGDDVRNIDWNVTARTGDPYIKIFEEERELTVMLLIDMSRSAFFGTKNQFKNEILTEICAILAFSAINNNDKVGVIFFSDQIEKYIPPKKGKSHILRIIRELINFEPEGRGTDIGKTLEFFNNVIKKRSICFLLSDFMDKDYESALRIAARKHDIIGIQLTDPRELELPNVGLLRVEDAETGGVKWLDTASAKVREEYLNQYRDFRAYSKGAFAKTSADFTTINSEDDYVNELLKFFKRRAK
jgi:uncharacterized protein (DUF58 family)